MRTTKHSEWQGRYEQTEKGKEAARRYAQSPKGRASRARRDARYVATAKGALNYINAAAKRRDS